jgi:uncharacterized membrane protein
LIPHRMRDLSIMNTQRIHFLDIMRGVAVVVMVIGHSVDSVLSVDARTTEAFRLYDAVRGFTAPIFLFVAGFAFTVVTERRWTDYRSPSRLLRSRFLKVLLLLAVGYALHLPFFSMNKLIRGTRPEEYALLFQVDVLHCVAVSILLLQGIVFLTRTPTLFGRTVAVVAGALTLATPFVWSVDLGPIISPVFSPYFNQAQPSIFPIFPYAGFMLSGAVMGHYFLVARQKSQERAFFVGVLKLAVIAAVCGVVFDLLPLALYPPHDYWKASPNFFLLRLSAVLVVTTAFFFLRKLPSALENPVLALGQASLMVYATHLVLVYGSAVNLGLMQVIGKTLPYYAAAGVGIVVLVAMVLLTHLWEYLRTHHAWHSRFVQAGFAGTIAYYFFTNPW